MDATIALLQEDYRRQRLWQSKDLPGILAEVHLERILKEYTGDIKVVVDPILDEARTQGFIFKEQNGYLIAYSKETSRPQTEYDLITIIGGIPTVWEVKMIHRYPSDRSRKGVVKRSSGIQSVLNPGQIGKSLAPIEEFFWERCLYQGLLAYILVLPPGIINPQLKKQREFIKRGGLLVPFYYSYKDYRALVRKAASKHNLHRLYRSGAKGAKGK